MKKRGFLLCMLWLCCSCTGLPPIEPPGPGHAGDGLHLCTGTPFIRGSWQLVHSIQADLPQGRRSVLIGVSNLWSVSQSVHCVMMTVEGMVILDAVFGPNLTINKGVPPFDDERFARGVIDDIRLAVFPPPGTQPEPGFLEGQKPVCRYVTEDGRVTDVIGPTGLDWEIKRYSKSGDLNRTVQLTVKPVAVAEKSVPLPDRLRIIAPGALGYDLNLTLLEARSLEPSSEAE